MRPFGCEVYAYVPPEKRLKLDMRMISCKLLGYLPDRKGYRVLSRDQKILKVRDGRFVSSTPDSQAVEPGKNMDPSENRGDLSFSEESVSVQQADEGGIERFLHSVLQRRQQERAATAQRRTLDCVEVPAKLGTRTAQALLSFVTDDPGSYREAMNSDDAAKWKNAMDEEFTALQSMNTWTLCRPPRDTNVVGCR